MSLFLWEIQSEKFYDNGWSIDWINKKNPVAV